MRERTKKAMRIALCVLLALALAAGGAMLLLRDPREKRCAYGYGSDVAAHVVRDSVAQTLEDVLPKKDFQVASSSGGLISDHDLFMLVRAAKFHIRRDEALRQAYEEGRLPALYAYLDGFDSDRTVLRKAFADDVATVEPGAWMVSPVLLGLRASPRVRTVAAEVVDDDPLAAIHTCGQVLVQHVEERPTSYRIGSVCFSAAERAAQIKEAEDALRELVEAVDARAGDDADASAYARAAFEVLVQRLTYAEEGTSAHDNDVYGALVEGGARCYGLSGVLKLVLDARGIPNYIADGSKPSGRHSWNVVWTGGSWRVCDLTLMLNREEGNACLVLEQNFYTQHAYVPDDECRILELLYSRVVSEGLDA